MKKSTIIIIFSIFAMIMATSCGGKFNNGGNGTDSLVFDSIKVAPPCLR